MTEADYQKLEHQCLARIGEAIVTQAKLNLTANKSIHEGTLRNSVNYDIDLDDHKVTVGTNLLYGVYIEKGTGKYAEDGNGRPTPWTWYDPSGHYTKSGEPGFITTRGQKPKPWLRTATDAPEVQELIKNAGLKLGKDFVIEGLEVKSK